MPDAASDITSKLNRAIRALLISEDAGTEQDTIAEPSEQERPLPVTTISTGDGSPFDGPGNQQFPVSITLHDPGIGNPESITIDGTRRAANTRLTNVHNALCQSDDEHTLKYTAGLLTTAGRDLASTGTAAQQAANADMADFTVLWWEYVTTGASTLSSSELGTFWERSLQFRAVACNNNL